MANAVYEQIILDCRVLVDGKWIDAQCLKRDGKWWVQRENFPESRYIYYPIKIGSDEIRFPKRYHLRCIVGKQNYRWFGRKHTFGFNIDRRVISLTRSGKTLLYPDCRVHQSYT